MPPKQYNYKRDVPKERRLVEYNRTLWIWECNCRKSGGRATREMARRDYEHHWREKHGKG